MKVVRDVYGLFLLVILLVACGTNLPETRPGDFYVTTYSGGGMTPEGYSTKLSEKESYYQAWVNGVRFSVFFEVTPAQLDQVYQSLREQQFDRIQTYEEMVYDRGGSSIQVQANQEFYDVSDGGMSFIEANWQANYEAVWKTLDEVIPPAGGTPIEIKWQEKNHFTGMAIELSAGSAFNGVTDIGLDSSQAKVWFSTLPQTVEITVLYQDQTFVYPLNATQFNKVTIDINSDEVIFIPSQQNQ